MVGATPLTVTQLGRLHLSGSHHSHIVKLVRAGDNTDVPDGSVSVSLPSGPAGEFAYVALPSPVTLQANTAYYLFSSEVAGGDRWSDYSRVATSSAATITGPEYLNSDGSAVLIPIGNYSYVPVNLIYTADAGATPQSAPTGSAGTALAGPAPFQFQVDGTLATFGSTAFSNATYSAASPSAVVAFSNTMASPSLPYPVKTAATPRPPQYGSISGGSSSLIGSYSPVAPARNDFSSWLGLQFTVGSTPVTLTALGRLNLNGSTGTHTLKLVNPSDGSDAGVSATVALSAATAGQFVYSQLPTPFSLVAGSTYYLVSEETSGGDPWYEWNTLVTPASPLIAITAPVYFSGLYYAIGSTPNSSYVPVNMMFTTSVASNPPAVSITSPPSGSMIFGTSVQVTATATASSGLAIGNVTFAVDGNVLPGTVTNSGSFYSISVDTTRLANGMHTFTAFATDSANASTTSSGVAVTVNNLPTTISVTGPAANASVAGIITISAAATPGTGLTISNVQFKVDGAPLIGTVTNSGNSYSIGLDTTKLTNTTHVITAVAVDSANTVVTSAGVSVTVNNQATAISITSPAANTTLSGSISLSATATPGTGLTISSVQFKVDGTLLTGTVTNIGNSYSMVLDTTKLTNTSHVIAAVVNDSANTAVTSAGVSVIVNNQPTAISVTSPAANATLSGSVTVSATATPGTGLTISSVQFKVDGNMLAGSISNSGNTYSILLDTMKLLNYSHVITAVAIDSANTVVTSAGVSVMINNQATTISITAPAANATVAGSTLLSATATPGTGLFISSVQFKLDGTLLTGTVTNSGNSYSIAMDTTKLTNTSHVITAVATDSANTVVTSAGVPVTVNNQATSISITSPATNATLSGSISVSATATPSTGLTISSVQFKLDGNALAGSISNSGTSYSIVLDTTKLTNSSHTITAVATDSANTAVTSAGVSVTVNNQATAISITTPAVNATVSGSIMVFATATPGAGLSIVSVVFKVDSVTLTGVVTNSGTSYSLLVDTTQLSNSAHLFTAVATDSASHIVTSAAVSVAVNNAVTSSLPAGMSFDGTIFTAGDEYRFPPKLPGQGPQSINRGLHYFNNVGDPVLAVGYNQSFTGGLLQSGEPGLSWNIEGNYNDGTSDPKMEAYLQYVAEDGTTVIRPFFFQFDRVTKKLVGSLLQGDPLNINSSSTGEPLAQFWTSVTILFKPVRVNASLAAQVIQSIPQATDPGCDPASIGKIWFDNTVNTTVERHCLSISGVPTWVVK
jgi:hypothetical protein